MDIKEDLKEIKQDVKTLLERSAIHNQILAEHKAYSLALQAEQKVLHAELEPIKKHVVIVDACAKILLAIFVGVAINFCMKRYF